jgi:peptidoglycan biosynthesis protein MviN/MurJ (putative lipid II flippase)
MQTTIKQSRKYLATPIFGAAMGVVYLVALSVAGSPVYGVIAFAVMVAFSGALLLARRRSETVKGLLDHRDERISAIDLRATAWTALAMIAVVLVAFVVQIARGQSGWPYSMIGFVGGLTYVVAVIYLRVRH